MGETAPTQRRPAGPTPARDAGQPAERHPAEARTPSLAGRRRVRPRLALVAAAFAYAALAAPSLGVSRAAGLPALYVTFLADHTFSVTLADGTPVGASSGPATMISAGSYQLFLNDASGAVMQFDLTGPGVDLVTNMTDGEDLSASYVETFQPNSTYTYQDDDQPGLVWTFATTSAAASPTPAATPSPTTPGGLGSGSTGTSSGSTSSVLGTPTAGSPAQLPLRGSLSGVVNLDGKLSLRFKGKEVTTLRAGRYTMTVIDDSRKNGFLLQEIDRQAITLTKTTFVGKRTATVSLTAGQWFYYPAFVGPKTYFMVPRDSVARHQYRIASRTYVTRQHQS